MLFGRLILISLLLGVFSTSSKAADETFYYLLSEPLKTDVKLGPLARNLHYSLETGWQFVKAGLAIYASGQVWVGVVLFVEESLKLPPTITAQSLVDLEIRAHWKNFLQLKELSKIPNATKLMLLSTAENSFDRFGIVIESQARNSLVFVETHSPLPSDWQSKWGHPIQIVDLDQTMIRLKFFMGDKQVDGNLSLSLRDFFSETPIPRETAQLWRSEFQKEKRELMQKIGSGKANAVDRSRALLREYFRRSILSSLKIEAELIDPEGQVKPIGVLAERKAAARLIGMSLRQRISRSVRQIFNLAILGEARLPYRERLVEKGSCGNLLAHLKAHFVRGASSFKKTPL